MLAADPERLRATRLVVQLADLDRFVKKAIPAFCDPRTRRGGVSPKLSRRVPVWREPAHRRGRSTSDFDFGAELDDLTGGDPEKLGRMRRNARQPRIETLAPSCHSRALGRFDIEPPDKERHLAGVKIEPRNICTAKLPRNIRRLGKAEMNFDLPEALAELMRANPIFTCHRGMFSVTMRPLWVSKADLCRR